jgi:hypothetical protein
MGKGKVMRFLIMADGCWFLVEDRKTNIILGRFWQYKYALLFVEALESKEG